MTIVLKNFEYWNTSEELTCFVVILNQLAIANQVNLEDVVGVSLDLPKESNRANLKGIVNF